MCVSYPPKIGYFWKIRHEYDDIFEKSSNIGTNESNNFYFFVIFRHLCPLVFIVTVQKIAEKGILYYTTTIINVIFQL